MLLFYLQYIKVWYIYDDIWLFQDFFHIFHVVTFDDLPKVKRGLTQMSSISSLHRNSLTKNLWKFQSSFFSANFWCNMTYDYLMKVKRSHDHTILTKCLICSFFILDLSMFDILVTINDHSMIFFFIFICGDLWWPRQGQTRSQPDGFYI